MAHPCFDCGGECYCHGDIDDVIVSHTPRGCEGCGCENCFDDDDDDMDDRFDDDDDFEPCAHCDQPDACADFGCAIKTGVRRNPPVDGIF